MPGNLAAMLGDRLEPNMPSPVAANVLCADDCLFQPFPTFELLQMLLRSRRGEGED